MDLDCAHVHPDPDFQAFWLDVWFEASGESPQASYRARRWRERRYIKALKARVEDSESPLAQDQPSG